MGYLNFERVVFQKDVRLMRTVFGKKVSFSHSHFLSNSNFMGSCFGGENPVELWDKCGADFSYVQFDGHAEFDQAQFDRTARFKCAKLKAANFRLAYFCMNADFRHVLFNGDVTFTNSTFTKDSLFTRGHNLEIQ